MTKTIALRTELQRLLKTLTTNVYYEEAPDTATSYLVYELSEVTKEYGRILMQLEINILDYGTSSTAAETLADQVQTVLHKYHFINSSIQFTLYEGLRGTVKEEDKQIIRRRLLFEVHLHELKGE